MISYYDGQLTDILPENITKKPEIRALSYALQQSCRLLYSYSRQLCVYSGSDSQPEEITDLLATELRTQYYNKSLDLNTKRQLVKNTLIWYEKAGTPEAVEELVATVFGEGKVEEWFEYGGKPYWFRIQTDALLTEDTAAYLSDMIRKMKNARSHMESIKIHRIINLEIYTGSGLASPYSRDSLTDGYKTERREEPGYYAVVAGNRQYRPEAIMESWEEEHKKQEEKYNATAF